jgi:Glutathione S-transferase, N-terminal domain
MIEVWGRKNSFNVQKVLWCCEELDVPYRRHDAGGLFGGTDEDEYLAANPTGLVPTISDEGFTLWESNTIVRYLSAKHGAGTLWPEDLAERALADKWMDFQLGTFFPAFKDALLGLVRTPPEQRDDEKYRRRYAPRPAFCPSWMTISGNTTMWLAPPLPWATSRSGRSSTVGSSSTSTGRTSPLCRPGMDVSQNVPPTRRPSWSPSG